MSANKVRQTTNLGAQNLGGGLGGGLPLGRFGGLDFPHPAWGILGAWCKLKAEGPVGDGDYIGVDQGLRVGHHCAVHCDGVRLTEVGYKCLQAVHMAITRQLQRKSPK